MSKKIYIFLSIQVRISHELSEEEDEFVGKRTTEVQERMKEKDINGKKVRMSIHSVNGEWSIFVLFMLQVLD